MIGNRYLDQIYNERDEDTSLNQLLQLLQSKDRGFIKSLTTEPIEVELLDERELLFITKVVALIDYYLQAQHIVVPLWLRHPRLSMKYPYYHQKRLSDFEKIRLIYTAPAPFRNRNVYFDLDAIKRV